MKKIIMIRFDVLASPFNLYNGTREKHSGSRKKGQPD